MSASLNGKFSFLGLIKPMIFCLLDFFFRSHAALLTWQDDVSASKYNNGVISLLFFTIITGYLPFVSTPFNFDLVITLRDDGVAG
jgi:hypothetical protein